LYNISRIVEVAIIFERSIVYLELTGTKKYIESFKENVKEK